MSVLDGPGHNFRSAGGTAVYQHHQRNVRRLASRLNAKRLDIAVAVLFQNYISAAKKLAGGGYGFIEHSTGIIAHIQNYPGKTLVPDFSKSFAEFPRNPLSEPGDSQMSWPAVEAAVGGSPANDYRLNFVAADGTLWWTQDAASATSALVDRHVTQDRDTTWHVVAQRKQTVSNTDFTISWYSTQQAYANRNATPISRAADCYTQGPDGMPSRLARPCPLTDGSMTTKFAPVTQQCPSGQSCPPINNWMLIDIGIPHPLGLIVLYDVSTSNGATSIVVETSADLATWTSQVTVPAKPYQTAPLTTTAQYVRLRLSDPNAQWSGAGNGEVAIFAPF